jgi:hypothetical protein
MFQTDSTRAAFRVSGSADAELISLLRQERSLREEHMRALEVAEDAERDSTPDAARLARMAADLNFEADELVARVIATPALTPEGVRAKLSWAIEDEDVWTVALNGPSYEQGMLAAVLCDLERMAQRRGEGMFEPALHPVGRDARSQVRRAHGVEALGSSSVLPA